MMKLPTRLSLPSNQVDLSWLRQFNKRATNRLTMRFAGKHVYAVIHHQGRKSGKAYRTPVVAMPSGSGFLIPLPYSANVDWCRNIIAAGSCQLEWCGRLYTLNSPRMVEPKEALPDFPFWMRPLLGKSKAYLRMEQAGAPGLPAERAMRKILVFGAGVLGSLYAGKLYQAGYAVTLLARGKRLEDLRENGLRLLDDETGRLECVPIPVTDRLGLDDAYDLVMVVVRRNQIPSVLPALAANTHTPNVLFLVNNAGGPGPMVEALGRERVLLGFPGAGGQRIDGIVRYRQASFVQPTTIGELSGKKTARLEQISAALKDAGLAAATCDHMDAWLKTHVALVSPIANALYLAGGSNYRLARTRDGLVLMIRAVREGLRVLRALHVPITPANYRVLEWLPEPLLVSLLHRRMAMPQAELVLARHANAARDEMAMLAEEFRALAKQSGVSTPAMDVLYCYINPMTPPMPEARANLPLKWRSTAVAAGALAASLAAGWLLMRRRKQ